MEGGWPSLACRGPQPPCASSLPSRTLSPRVVPENWLSRRLPAWVGETPAAHLVGAGEPQCGPGRQALRADPSEGMSAVSAAALPLLTREFGAHRRWGVCILAPVPLERLLPQAGQPLLLLATLMLLRLYFK